MSCCVGKLLLVATIVWLLHVVHILVKLPLCVGLLVLVLLVLGLIVAWLHCCLAGRQASSPAVQRLTAARHNEVQLIRS